jgi:hypothetical protein
MNKLFKSIVIGVIVTTLMLMSVGCFGSFNLTKKVYKWNGSVGDKWVNELVFLVLNVVPVYSVAGGIDVVILNTIEFWTGSNPVAANVNTDDGTKLAFNAEKKELSISYGAKSYVVCQENGKAAVKNEQGTIIAYCVSSTDGGMTITDAQGKTLSQYSPDQVSAMFAAR